MQTNLAEARASFPTHLTSIDDLSWDQIELLHERAEWIEAQPNKDLKDIRPTSILGVLFYQNSTRTRLSFESAIHRIGGSSIGFSDVKNTRAGDFFSESLADTVSIISQYVDCIVLRHPDNDSMNVAIDHSCVPVINGGNGDIEHPTQALLDVWMLKKVLHSLKGATIGLFGSPSCRDFKSLLKLLCIYQVENIILLAPVGHDLSEQEKALLSKHKIHYKFVDNTDALLVDSDAVCSIPFVLPNFNACSLSQTMKEKSLPSQFVISENQLNALGNNCPPILHVGPRGPELAGNTDKHENVLYYQQAKCGVYLRAALLDLLLEP